MIKSVCILGGGTAGFMTAAVLSKLDLEVKCIYSSKIGNIGVGESTQLCIRDIFNFLGIQDEDWMSECNATYKTNIAFESWNKDGEQFFYPFELLKKSKTDTKKFFELCALFPDEIKNTDFARFQSPTSRFAEYNRLTDKDCNFNEITAFHFDTHLLSKILMNYASNNGVEFIDDTYIRCSKDKTKIKSLTCKNTGQHEADLFVDCSGFKSLLLGKELKVPFKKYQSQINDRVIRCKVPYKNKQNQLKNYTNNVTMKNGWCWEIPLWDGMSLGYVHSLKFTNKKQIEKEFYEYVNQKYEYDPKDLSVINFKSGRYEQGWVNNVASVGLSYGFIEPLESTGLVSVIKNIFSLVEIISQNNNVNAFDKKLFNYSISQSLDSQKTFVDMHYVAAHRCDTKYWNFITNEMQQDWSGEDQKLSLEMTALKRDYADSYLGGLPYILAGNGYSPLNQGTQIFVDNDFKKEWLMEDKECNDYVMSVPSTYEFLKQKIYTECWQDQLDNFLSTLS
jgi:tryptophan halogenase